jgi:hypothetical protein
LCSFDGREWRAIAVVEDQVMIVAEPGLRDDNRCRLFITDLPAR